MALSARRPLVLVLVTAVGGVSGVGATAAAKPRTKDTRPRKAKHKVPRVRAVKLGGGLAWAPAAALGAALAPLTGSGGPPAANRPATGAPAAPTTTTPGDAPSPPAPPAVEAVGVTLDDRGGYSARLTRGSVGSGAVVVQLVNQGEDDHNLRVVPTDHAGGAVDFPLTGPGANTTQTLTLTPGSYLLFCTLTTPVNHQTAGMHATLTVTVAAT